MDPISQGALGGVLPASVWKPKQFRVAVLLGAIAGMAPDLDVLIQSDADPLLFLEYHRQFTHALLFIPIGALLVAAIAYPFTRRILEFKHAYLACILGYATHGFLDACTTYGTQLLWPFTDYRVSWNFLSVLDPAFTLPLLVLLIIAIIKRSRISAWIGIAWVVAYLSLGAIQHERAVQHTLHVAKELGHEQITKLSAKPTIVNLVAWRGVYLHEGTFHTHGIHVGWTAKHCGSASAPQVDIGLHFPWLDPSSQQAKDLERFRWFSKDYLALDPKNPNRITDMRYSFVPNRVDLLWGIELDKQADKNQHIKYITDRRADDELTQALAAVITGEACD